ncbi:hypothetical protein [Tsukamurella strandjordii]|uniref:hypothetical protein n=1 Tax=Tsukamurella strandjordii TaxID=147577 RepID=UPI0031DA6430
MTDTQEAENNAMIEPANNLPAPRRPEVPTFNELDEATQARALYALGEYHLEPNPAALPMAVDESQLTAELRAKIDALTTDGYKVTITERSRTPKHLVDERTEQLRQWNELDATRPPFEQYLHKRAPHLARTLPTPIIVGDPQGKTPKTRWVPRQQPGGFNATVREGIRSLGDNAWIGVATLPVGFLFAPFLNPWLLAVMTTLVCLLPGVFYLLGADYTPAEKYALTDADKDAIIDATRTLDWNTPEVQLAAIAGVLADQITDLPAWNSDYLASQRVTFNPDTDATEIAQHARRIATMRARLGPSPSGDAPEHIAARNAVDDQHQILDTLTESLRRRVAALWAYHQTLTELDSRLTALRTLERYL